VRSPFGNYKTHIERLRFIRNCCALHMTHEEIRTRPGFMDRPAGYCSGVNQLLDACGILQWLASMETKPRHERLTHLG